MRRLIYLFVFCALVSCNGKKSTGQSGDGFIRIDMEEKYPKKDIFLQDVADVEYIPLETRSDVLLSRTALQRICMSDSLIVARSNGSVFIFNRQGKYIHSFDHSGRGVGEYSLFGKLAVDFVRQEIFISDAQLPKICVYGFDGSFKRVLKSDWSVVYLFNYNQEFLLGCFRGGSKDAGWLQGEADKQPYWLVSKESGEMSPLALTFQERKFSDAIFTEPDGSMVHMVWPLNSIAKNGEEFLIADFGTDTVYRLAGTTLTPYVLKSPSRIWKREIPIMGWVEFKTNRYIGLRFMELSLLKNILNKKILYDLVTGEAVEYNFLNQDYQPARKVFIDWEESEFDLPSGYLKFKLLASELKNDYEAGKLTGKLKEIAATLEEDANPVLMLVKFRD